MQLKFRRRLALMVVLGVPVLGLQETHAEQQVRAAPRSSKQVTKKPAAQGAEVQPASGKQDPALSAIVNPAGFNRASTCRASCSQSQRLQ
jgi:hypothetical protein